MFTYNGNYPLLGYYIEDDNNTQHRTPFKFRKVSDQGQFFNQSLSGLMDTGIGMVVVTPKYLRYKKGAKVIVDGIMYSVESITPFIPDNVTQGLVKRKVNAQYYINLV